MKVNSVTQYNNQSQNRINVKFGDCKKIVCEEAMIKAKKAFDKSSLKQGLDEMYIYQTHFRTSNKGYSMILKPYKGSLLYRLKNHFNHDFKLPNLPCEIKYEARYLNTPDLCINPYTSGLVGSLGMFGMPVVAAVLGLQHSNEEGLIDIINRLTDCDIREKIKNALDIKAQQ